MRLIPLLRSEAVIAALMGAFLGSVASYFGSSLLEKHKEEGDITSYMLTVAHESCEYAGVYKIMAGMLREDPSLVYNLKDIEPDEIVISSAPEKITHLNRQDFERVFTLRTINVAVNNLAKIITDAYDKDKKGKGCDDCFLKAVSSVSRDIDKYADDIKLQSNQIYKEYRQDYECRPSR
ncbi:hypothetical protein GLF_2503 [Gluconobacter frateurii NBRC 101659]|nr:hypothetical protein GLF_2503 [Gluconobacter frateurii NBRC 101659]